MTYRLDDESPEDFAARKEDLVVDGAVFLQECGSKVLKLEYPGSAGGVPARHRRDRRAVGGALGGRRPQAFCEQLRNAMAGGESREQSLRAHLGSALRRRRLRCEGWGAM